MKTPKLLTSLVLLAIGTLSIGNAIADPAGSDQTHNKAKIATITQMYEQDVKNEGMDNPVVLQQFANAELQAAMQLEQDYFDKEQMSCHIGYDVLWNSQDPDYSQDKQFSITEQGLVQVSLQHGGNVYYDLTCNDSADCQVADVIMDDDGASLRKHLLETCR